MNIHRYEIHQGSIYAPGWHVYEIVRENYWVSVGCFEERQDAEEWFALLETQEN